MEPLLFLKSINGQISLTNLSVTQLANCITTDDTLKVRCVLDVTCLAPNRTFNRSKASKTNDQELVLELENVTATNPQIVIDYLNDKLENINTFLIQRLSLCFFDKAVFKNTAFHRIAPRQEFTFNADEISLLKRYCDIAYFSRTVLHEALIRLLPDADVTLPKITYNNVKPYLSRDIEEEILKNSSLFLSIEERRVEEDTHFLNFIEFQDFYLTDLTRASAKKDALKQKLRGDCETYLSLVLGPAATTGQLTEEDESHVLLLLEDNVKLLKIGFKLNQILGLQLSKLSENFSSPLFAVSPINLSVDPFSGKAKFHLNSKAFLVQEIQTSITVLCSANVAYALGLPKNYLSLTIGPLSLTEPPTQTPPINQITKFEHRLPSAVRFHPKLVHIATNLLCHSETRDQWLVGSPYESFHVIYTQLLDSECLQSRFIAKSDTGQRAHKLMRSANIFHAIRFILLDENCRKLSFSRETIVNLGLQISPLLKQDM